MGPEPLVTKHPISEAFGTSLLETTNEGRRHVCLPFVLGLNYLPSHLEMDEWCWLESKTLRLSWLGTSLFLALSAKFLTALMQDRGLAGM
jgi:hypothetical protein